MEFFTIVGVLFVAFVVYLIVRAATESPALSVPQKNPLIKQHSMSLLLTHHMCSEKDIKHRIMTDLEIYDMFPDNMKNNASIFLAKARNEALERNIHMEDTQSFIIAEWIMEVYEKENKELKDDQKQQSVNLKVVLAPVTDDKTIKRDPEIFRRNVQQLANTYKCSVEEVMDVYLVKCGATIASDKDLLGQIRNLQISKEETGRGLSCHPDDTVFGIMQNWSSQYIILRKQVQLEKAKIEHAKRNTE